MLLLYESDEAFLEVWRKASHGRSKAQQGRSEISAGDPLCENNEALLELRRKTSHARSKAPQSLSAVIGVVETLCQNDEALLEVRRKASHGCSKVFQGRSLIPGKPLLCACDEVLLLLFREAITIRHHCSQTGLDVRVLAVQTSPFGLNPDRPLAPFLKRRSLLDGNIQPGIRVRQSQQINRAEVLYDLTD